MSEIDAASAKDCRILIVLFTIPLVVGGILFGAAYGNATICRNTEPRVVLIAIEMAINDFYGEYGELPDVANHVSTHSPEGSKLLNILLGFDAKSGSALNSRVIRFLSIKEGKNKKNGLIYANDGGSVEGLFDPWGNPYTVFLAGKDSNELHFTIAGKSIDLQGRRVAAVSPGADGKLGTSDDVRNW